MAVTESFLVNTNSFNSIIEALIELNEIPDTITDDLFQTLGFDSPSDLLVIHMLKELGMITVDGEPTDLYKELIDLDTTNEAVAIGIINAYAGLFENNKDFHKLQHSEIKDTLNSYFEGRKTDLILKYMTNTFQKLVTYAGHKNLQKAVEKHFKGETEVEDTVADEESSPVDDVITSEQAEPAAEEKADTHTEEEQSLKQVDEQDSEFDDIFFGEDSEQAEQTAEEPEALEETPEKRKNASINFDELPQVHQEDKGTKHIDDLWAEDEDIESQAEGGHTDETEDEIQENDYSEHELIEDTAEKEPVSKEDQESLEQELLTIKAIESMNGFNKNGSETTEKPMSNFRNIPMNEKVEKALIKKAELLYKLERFEDVLPAYKDIISYFDESENDHLQKAVANAVINRVAILNKLNRKDQLLPALDEVINRFENSSTTEYYEQASMAMLQKSQLLEDESDDELLPLYNAIIDRLGNASNPKIKTQVDEVFISKVDILTESGPEHELLEAVDELIARFKGSQLHTGQLEQAMYKKAEILEGLDRNEEALEAYTEFLDKFGKTSELV